MKDGEMRFVPRKKLHLQAEEVVEGIRTMRIDRDRRRKESSSSSDEKKRSPNDFG